METRKLRADLRPLKGRFARFGDYQGLWSYESSRLAAMLALVESLDMTAHLAARDGLAFGIDAPEIADGIAIIDLAGTLMKFTSSLDDGTSTVAARRQIRQAARDSKIRGIVLRIDSPGGSVSGTADLVAAVAAAARAKPVVAYVEDLCASAAYWIASQANTIYANNKTAFVGSIGTYAVVADLSGLAAKRGIRVHTIKAGEFKGMATPGTEVTDAQLAEVQRLVDAANAEFLQAVASGRRMTAARVAGLADGRIHPAQDAAGLGLIDGIRSLDQVVSSIPRPEPAARPVRVAATLTDLWSGLPGIDTSARPEDGFGDGAFLKTVLDAGRTLAEARTDWAKEQDRRKMYQRLNSR
jgi:signal peptide peptidase SppA